MPCVMLRERVIGARKTGIPPANGPYVGGRHRCHGIKQVVVARTGTGYYRPLLSVPVFY